MPKNTPTLEERLFSAHADGMRALNRLLLHFTGSDFMKTLNTARSPNPIYIDDSVETLIYKESKEYVEEVMELREDARKNN